MVTVVVLRAENAANLARLSTQPLVVYDGRVEGDCGCGVHSVCSWLWYDLVWLILGRGSGAGLGSSSLFQINTLKVAHRLLHNQEPGALLL